MKWVGQHIYDLVSRFRDDVYLEDVSSGTIASGGNLGLDSNNKIVKAAEVGSAVDLTSEVTGTLPVANGGTGATSLTDGGILLGSGTAAVTAAAVLGDGEILIGDGTTDPVALDVGSSTAITTLGTIATGVWNGTAIASAYLDADTAHLTTAQTFTGSKTMGTTTKFNFRDANSYIYSPTANDLEIVATDITLDAAAQIFLEQDTTVTGNFAVNGDYAVFTSSTANRPQIQIRNTADDATPGNIAFMKDRGAAAVNSDDIGRFDFIGENDAEEAIYYGRILVEALEVDDTDEAGKMSFLVAESNGTTSGLTTGLLIEGSDNTTDGEVNVTIAAGDASVTSVAGSLRPKGQIVLMKSGFKDSLSTTKHYLPLQSELEQTTYNHEMNMFVAPYPGKLLKIMYNGSGNFSGGDVSFTFEQIPRNVAWTTPTVLETVTVTGPTNGATDPNMVTASFGASSAFVAGDMLMVGLQYDTGVGSSNSRHFFTLVFEFDFSGLA